MLVGFINLWDPQAWGYAETVVLFAAVIIGGLGNHRGAMLGAILVPVAFEEATRYIPPVTGNPNLVPALQWVVDRSADPRCSCGFAHRASCPSAGAS